MALNLWLKSLVSLGFVLILTSCIPIEDPPISPSDSTITDTNDASLENIISGETECDNPGNISSDGKYLCEGHGAYYWISIENLESEPSQNTSSNQDNGYWKNNCTYVDVPNPNYDARKGFSAWVNEPTIRTQQCSQIWVDQNTSSSQDNGYWKNNCTYVDVPNPNYDARKGFSAWVNEPTIRTQQCSQIWVND